jgi:anti-anti-sigma factor
VSVTCQSRHPWMSLQPVGDLTLVRFTQRNLLDEEPIRFLAEQLGRLIEAERRRFLIVSFANVQRITSILLGKLVKLHRTAEQAGGRLAVCELNDRVREVFDTLHLSQLLNVYDTEQDAFASF